MAFTNNDCGVDHVFDCTVDKICLGDKDLRTSHGLSILQSLAKIIEDHCL